MKPDFVRTQEEAGCQWMILVSKTRRDALLLHWGIAGVAIGMMAFGVAAKFLVMVP